MDTLEKEKHCKEEFEHLNQYDYGFENLAFEGGGAKIVGYAGAVKVLEELGILQNCKRFAGTSGGAIVASLLATGHNAAELREIMDLPIQDLLLDSWYGKLAMLPNLYNKFGWNPGSKFLEEMRRIMKEKTGNPDTTFMEVYKKYKKVLCVVGTNISTMSVEYFHPKTTPNFSVALAVRISVSLPGYLQPVCTKNQAGLSQYYVDGGVVCNYPIHAFDGWYLSMKPEDSFFNKLGGEDPIFGEFNCKTIGILLYTLWEEEFMKGDLHKKQQHLTIQRPVTDLASSRAEECETYLREYSQKLRLVEAGKRFLKTLREVDVSKDSMISFAEFKKAFNKLQVNPEDVELMFGKDFSLEESFKQIEQSNDGQISFEEFLCHLQKQGVRFRALLEGGNMIEVNSLGKFFEVVLNTGMNLSRKVHFKEEDSKRTIGIYTDYIYTTDFKLDKEDKAFLVRQGVIGALEFFMDLHDKKAKGKIPQGMTECISPKAKSAFGM